MTYSQFRDVYLCTMDDFKQQRYGGGTSETYSTDDENTIDLSIRQASRMIVDEVLYQLPLPYTQTMLFDAPHSYEDGRVAGYDYAYSYTLHTSDVAPLISVTTLTNGDGTTIASSGYVLYPANSYPKNLIRIKNTNTTTFDYDDVWEQAISVAGVWGYVPHYANAFTSTSDTTITTTSSATTITVSDGTEYQEKQYIKIEDEMLLITSISTNDLTVQRGQLGTTAASHTSKAITIFVQNQQISLYTAQLASALYNQLRSFYDAGAPTTQDIMNDARMMLAGHARMNLI